MEEASHETILLEAFSMKFGGSLARNDHFGSFFCQNCWSRRAKRSFWKLVREISKKPGTKRSFWKLCSMKFGGSVARNDHFGSFFCQNCRTPRAKCSFWKLCPMKFGGSVALNDHFGSFFCRNCRTPRAKCSFWKLCPMKFRGSLARNDHFGSFVL